MHTWKKKFILICLTILLGLSGMFNPEWVHADTFAEPSFNKPSKMDNINSKEQSWIIKWKDAEDPAFSSVSEIIEEMSQFNAVVARAAEEYDVNKWIKQWENSDYVEYIQLNHKVQIAAKPDDPYYSSQKYLNQIKVEAAWDTVSENRGRIIAIVDTGIDLTHPDLKNNLVSGRNVIDPAKSAQDDNGHGTSIAGVIAASGNNGEGIAGILWGSRIMPIKAVESNGTTDESKLGQGIRYAVDNGASIVVLSLGLYKYSPFMRDVVLYAESKNVLLVAASGNDGQEVKYPAAYPTVLAVGGVNESNQVVSNSNFGPELDIVAPWKVYTTALGGAYGKNEGTSMAAPQAAAAAALIWAKNPNMKPYQIRNLLRQTAEDVGPSGWDYRSGYGLLRIDRALNQGYREDIYENNNIRSQAKPMPVGSMLSASLSSNTDTDWYSIAAPYKGEITLRFTTDQQVSLSQMELVHYEANSNQGTVYNDLISTITIPVSKGQNFIQIKALESASNKVINYRVVSQFNVYRDAFEDNDRQFKAYVLPTQVQSVTGTFHQLNDEDWFALSIQQSGSLRVKASTDTYRVDLELMVQKQGEKGATYDYFFDGESEYTPTIDVLPGKYYIRVRNAISDQAHPVIGEYTLDINYTRKFVDPNEPNDRAFQATTLGLGKDYSGVLVDQDNDWFSFKVAAGNYVTIDLSNIPVDRMMSLSLLNNNQRQLSKDINTLGDRRMKVSRMLPEGTYYIRLTSNLSFNYQMYNLKVTSEQLVSGYRDITNHWARADIVRLTDMEIVNGYADHLFNPDKIITRAEAVTMIVKALKLTSGNKSTFTDVSEAHWAYKDISIAEAAGIINGYPDGTFKPNQPTTRVEMTAMIANALGITGSSAGDNPFNDISENYWAIDMLRQMKADGWVNGYEDGSFRPNKTATRAEFVTFISRVVQ